MNINWSVRFKNKTFWLSFIPAMILLAQAIMQAVGLDISVLAGIEQSAINIVNAVFGVLAVLGVVTDHTTTGFSDSEQALGYDKPE